MKYTILIALALFSSNLLAQSNYSEIDEFVKSNKFKASNVPTLSKELTEGFDKDEEKLRAIFIWITDNIAYDCKKFHSGMVQNGMQIEASTEEEIQAKIAQFREAEMAKTLNKKRGICQDYSYLFQAMCKEIGIEADFIIGHTRKSRNSIGKIPRIYDHAWNAVKLNDEWLMVDATWGAGSADPECKNFLKRQKDAYFLVKPSNLIKSHLPKEENQQYLKKAVSKENFSAAPYVSYGFHALRVEDYFPKKGTITLNNKTEIKLKLGKQIKPSQLLLFSGTKNIKLSTKEEDGYLVLVFDRKQIRGRQLSIIVQNSEGELDEVISYKLK